MVLWLETLAVSESLIDGRHLKEKIQEAVSLNSPNIWARSPPVFAPSPPTSNDDKAFHHGGIVVK
jgi:hypothetical protein